MADKWYTSASGNWSTAANWNGGTLPTAADDVYADGKAVVIDQNVTVLSIRTTQRSGGTVGGTFTISAAGITVTCTSSGILSGTIGGGLLITATTGTTTLNSNLTGGAASGYNACLLSGATTLVISGNLLAGTNSNTHALSVTSTSTINITGNLTGGSSTGHGVSITAAATLTVTGNVTGGTIGNSNGISNTTVAATINIIGNVTAQVGVGISSAIASIVTVKGIITSSNTIAGVSLSSTSVSLTFSGQAINNNNVMAIYSQVLRLYTSDTVQWTFQNNTGGNKILYSAGIALGNPATTDVRNGTTYGASNELTGTLIVPNPSNVLSGVPTDNTVGTYSTTPALIATEIFTKLLSNSDFNTAGSFGKLIKDNVDAKSSEIKAKTDLIPTNPASVQSVGAIVSSYNV
jgi:hypothetical protein